MFGADSPRLGESIRLSFGAQTTKADIQAFIDALLPIVQRLPGKNNRRDKSGLRVTRYHAFQRLKAPKLSVTT